MLLPKAVNVILGITSLQKAVHLLFELCLCTDMQEIKPHRTESDVREIEQRQRMMKKAPEDKIHGGISVIDRFVKVIDIHIKLNLLIRYSSIIASTDKKYNRN